ncbi:MAG: putative metal-binding motif-containing protein [Pseudomonadota bacterium]
MRSLSLMFLLLLGACRTDDSKPDTGLTGDDCTWYADADGDGWGADGDSALGPCGDPPAGSAAEGGDCDDEDPAVNPGAAELCDDVDQDCDGEVDEDATDAGTWYTDGDGDGYGDPDLALTACEGPTGRVQQGGDCDDGDATVHPDAPERCNGLDDDCDGAVDEDVEDHWYADTDEDGWGNAEATLESCDPGEGWTDVAGDCDDSDPGVHPEAEEVCDGLDNDCDGVVDEDLGATWYADADGDGYGDPGLTLVACEPGPGWVADASDCDDASSAIHPGATERCNGYDDDCDALIDDDDPDIADQVTWYVDDDGDGYGDGEVLACTQPAGTAPWGGDCDDADPAYNPGATEDDCTDPNDYNCDGSTGYADLDGDGWAACEDCDDGEATIYPGAAEVCDGVDDDCDGTVDEPDAVDADTWYADADGDGYGEPASTTAACTAPSGYVADDSDCDDGDASVNPAAAEVCDGVDQDCDGSVDEGVLSTFYADADGDGFGDVGAVIEACGAPSGYVADATDCDDGAAAVNPAATEVCDGVDDDCDGLVDEADASGAPTWYQDDDGDGYGDAAADTVACAAPSGYVADATDCDDGDAAVNPGAAEVCDGVDQDCDGAIDEGVLSTFFADADGDGFGDAASSTTACAAPSGYVADASDCDDGDAGTHPGAAEVCDGVDLDCDGAIDEGVLSTFYADTDGDGFGDAGSATTACAAPSGYVATASDCDDGDAGVNPAATEQCDGVDQDCSGSLSWLEEDGDGDGLLACEDSLWLATDGAINNTPSSSGRYGSSQAAALLAAWGVSFDEARHSSATLTASLLEDYGLLVVHGQAIDGAFSAAEAEALEDWVRAGGSLLYVAYHPSAYTCAQVNSLPAAFGITCTGYASYWGGMARPTGTHDLTDGVTVMVGMGGELWAAASPALTVLAYSALPAEVAVELDAGRVVGLSDEWLLYDAGTGAADISTGDNQRVVDNAWGWLTDFAL